MQKIMTCVGIVGVMVVGAMCKDMFWASIPVAIGSGDDAQTLQDILDGIMPGMLGMIAFWLYYWLLSKKINPMVLIVATMVVGIIGARNKDLLLFEKELASFVDELLISTDDGSYGHKGLVTDLLRDRLESDKDVFEVVAVGPVPMMAAVANTTRPYGVHTTVSLNPIMVDGIGMCGACRVTVDGKTKFACVDGPEFDGHKVDFDELRRRLGAYRDQEKVSIDQYRSTHGN